MKRRSWPTKRIVFAWISSFLLLVLAEPAWAHGYIVRSIPQDRAVLERSPARLQYWFSENLEPEFSKLTVRDQAGNVVAEGGVDPADLALLAVRLPPALPDGAYVAELRTAFASDGHVVVETRVFFVGAQVGGVGEADGGYAAVPLEVVWRVIVLASTLLLLGTFAVYSMVLVPAWGSSKYPAGLLPPRVMRRLNWIVAVTLAVAFAGNILALLQQSMVFFGADIGRVISEGLFNVVRIGTRFGDTWNVRMFLLVLVTGLFGASLYFRSSQPASVRAFWVANVWGMVLVVGTFSVASHAAGSLLLPWLAIAADWLHGTAVGLWAGGVAALALIAPTALQPYAGDERRQALLAALRRFTRIATAGLAIVVTTGIYSALNWLTQPADLTTSYGGALILKLLLVGLLVAVGAAHHAAVNPARYARWAAVIARVRAFVPTLRLEALLALLVLLAVGYLSATPIPQPVVAEQAAAPSATQVADGYTVTATITPGGPGVNTYDVQIERDGQPADGLTVTLRLAEPARDRRSDWQALDGSGDGLYASVGDDIAGVGDWWALVDIQNGGQTTRVAFDWPISADAAVIVARPPTILNLLALLGVLAALVYAAWPLLLRFYHALDLSPQAVTVALLATAAAVGVVVLGVNLTQQSGEQVDLAMYPPPQVVNAALPDGASLARGQALFAADCAAWSSNNDLGELVRRLPRLRDEELYAAVTDAGWWSLPPCGVGAKDAWDVVNYLRSLETSS